MEGTFFFNVVVMVIFWSTTGAAVGGSSMSISSTPVHTPAQTSAIAPSTPTKPPSSVTVTPSTNSTQASVVPTSYENGTTPSPTNGTHTKPLSTTVTAIVTVTPSPHGNYTTIKPSGHRNHSMKPGCHEDSRGKWVAVGFAIFFSITTGVMTVLYCRQRKIYRELEGDSSLSRLI